MEFDQICRPVSTRHFLCKIFALLLSFTHYRTFINCASVKSHFLFASIAAFYQGGVHQDEVQQILFSPSLGGFLSCSKGTEVAMYLGELQTCKQKSCFRVSQRMNLTSNKLSDLPFWRKVIIVIFRVQKMSSPIGSGNLELFPLRVERTTLVMQIWDIWGCKQPRDSHAVLFSGRERNQLF